VLLVCSKKFNLEQEMENASFTPEFAEPGRFYIGGVALERLGEAMLFPCLRRLRQGLLSAFPISFLLLEL
jgi:hypothetical protein